MEEEIFEVDSILDYKKRGKRNYYLVHWKGYPHTEDSWEPETNLNNCSNLIQQFQKSLGKSKTNLENDSPKDCIPEIEIFNVILKNNEVQYYAKKDNMAFMITKKHQPIQRRYYSILGTKMD